MYYMLCVLCQRKVVCNVQVQDIANICILQVYILVTDNDKLLHRGSLLLILKNRTK